MPVVIERYPAVVTDNQDPDKDFQVKVKCAGLLGDEEAELPFWIPPTLDWGWVYVPDIDEQIEIEVVVSSDQDEIFGQSTLEHLNATWRGKRFYSTEATPPTPILDVFRENYGKRRGFATPAGHYFVFDDTDGSVTWILNWQNGDDDFTQMIIDTDGTVKLLRADKSTLHLKDSELELLVDGNGAGLKITGKDGNTVALFGNAGVKATIADHLEVLWGNLKTWLDAHTHTTGMGPSGPPIPPVSPAWDGNINSSKLKFPDG